MVECQTAYTRRQACSPTRVGLRFGFQLDGHDGNEAVDGIQATRCDALVVVDAVARVLQETRHVIDGGAIRISIVRGLASICARIGEVVGGYDGRLGRRISDKPVPAKVIAVQTVSVDVNEM